MALEGNNSFVELFQEERRERLPSARNRIPSYPVSGEMRSDEVL